MKCPVCKKECGYSSVCSQCNFTQVGKIFTNKAEAEQWTTEVVLPHRNAYIKNISSGKKPGSMKLFRQVEKQFCIIQGVHFAKMLSPKTEGANGVLAYGYVDMDAGLSYRALAPAFFKDGQCFIFEDKSDTNMVIRANSLKGLVPAAYSDVDWLDHSQKKMLTEAAESINEIYYRDKDVSECRNVVELDQFRHDDFPDDLLVFIYKEGMKPEQIWVREKKILYRTDKNVIFAGVLLNEPFTEIGFHKGDAVDCVSGRTDSGKWVCMVASD